MSALRTRGMALPLTLSAVALSLSYVVFEHWTDGPTGLSDPALATTTEPVPTARRQMAPTIPDLTELPETAARPLFTESRRPPDVEETVAPAEETVESGRFTLVGVTLFDRQRIALLRRRSGETVRVAYGQRLDGWRVTEIAAKHVDLQNGDRTERLRLFEFARVKPVERKSPIPVAEASDTEPDTAAATAAEDSQTDQGDDG